MSSEDEYKAELALSRERGLALLGDVVEALRTARGRKLALEAFEQLKEAERKAEAEPLTAAEAYGPLQPLVAHALRISIGVEEPSLLYLEDWARRMLRYLARERRDRETFDQAK